MGILSRYVCAELLKIFLLALTALASLMLIVGVVREAAAQSLPLAQILQLIPYILPDALRVAVPVTLLLATTVVYGRLSGANEVVAAKSLGISPMALLWPAFAAAFLISIVTVWLNDLAVSWGRNGAQRVVLEAVEDIAYSMLRSQRCYTSPKFSINVKDVRGRKLIRPTITLPTRDNAPMMVITGEWAKLRCDHESNVLKVELHNFTVHVGNKIRAVFPGTETRDIPLRDASRAKNLSTSASCSPLCDIPYEKEQQKRRIAQQEKKMAAVAAYQMMCGDFSKLADKTWDSEERQYRNMVGHLRRLNLEPHRRWSAGFSCLCFTLVGAPMAIRLPRSDFWTVFFLCFLPILIVYYPLLIYGINGAKGGTIPPQAVWAGNVLLALWGMWLLRRVLRY